MQGADRTIADDEAAQRAARLYRDHAAGGQPGAGTSTSATGDSDVPVAAPGSIPELPSPPIAVDPQPRYEVQGRLGRGGGGEVFTVADRRLVRSVAVKVMHAAHREDRRRAARFLGEAQITASLEHPSVLPVYDLGETADGRAWFSMRRASGPTLADLVARAEDGDLDERIRDLADRIAIGIRICDCIAYAHARGILHCDLKPGNILLGDYGEVLVVDWGTAAREAQAGRIAGTPLYMAPEQARGEPATPQSDVYGIAATLWHLLVLRPPLHADRDPEDFWCAKRAGTVDDPPATALAAIPASLLDLLREGLHAEAPRRPAGAIALRDRLRDWLRRREAETACDRIAAGLARLEGSGDHRSWQRAEDGLRQALALAPGHPRALALLDRVVSGHIAHAIALGELAVAAGLLDPALPGHAASVAALAAARRARRRQVHLRWGVAAAACAALLILAGLAWQQHRARFGSWMPVFAWDAGQPLSGLELRRNIGLEAEPLPPAGAGGLVLPRVYSLVLPVEERGDVRLTVDASWDEVVDGLELMLRVPPTAMPTAWTTPSGYLCQFGGFRGMRTLIAINRQPGALAVQAETSVSYQPGRTYRLEVELVGRRTRLSVDGRQVLDYEELLPVGDEGARCMAIRSWAGGVRLSRLRVERLGLPPRPSPLVIGDTLVGADQPARAVDAYLRVARDQPGGALAEEALAKAFITACMVPGKAGGRPELLDRLREGFPGSRWLAPCQEAQALRDWVGGSPERALEQAEGILAAHPASGIALRLVNQRPDDLPAAVVPRLLRLLGRSQGVESINLTGLLIADLSPLAGLRLRVLNLTDNRIADLSPLAGMPLVDLSLGHNRITDIAPLRGMRLDRCALIGNRITDLSPLAGMPLTSLTLDGNPITDLSPLAGMRLQSLDLRGLPIADLAPVEVGHLRYLTLAGTRIADLSRLASATALLRLDLAGAPVADMSPLAGCRQLTDLSAGGSRVADLSPLAGLPLVRLHLERTPLSDLSPLRGMERLTYISCGGSRVTDLSPLARTYPHPSHNRL